MPRYFTHLVDGTDTLLDPDGVERPADAVAAATLSQARLCMAEDVKDGRLDLGYRLEVHDESGAMVHCLPFAEALQIRRRPNDDTPTDLAA